MPLPYREYLIHNGMLTPNAPPKVYESTRPYLSQDDWGRYEAAREIAETADRGTRVRIVMQGGDLAPWMRVWAN